MEERTRAGVEDLAFDCAGLDHVGGEGLEGRLLPEVKAKGLHAAQEAFLEVADPAEAGGESALIPGEGGPVRPLVQVSWRRVCDVAEPGVRTHAGRAQI